MTAKRCGFSRFWLPKCFQNETNIEACVRRCSQFTFDSFSIPASVAAVKFEDADSTEELGKTIRLVLAKKPVCYVKAECERCYVNMEWSKHITNGATSNNFYHLLFTTRQIVVDFFLSTELYLLQELVRNKTPTLRNNSNNTQ